MSSIEKALEKLAENKSGKQSSTARAHRENSQPGSELVVDLDWETLEQRGILTPNSANRVAIDEYRVIKRPLLKYIFENPGFGGEARNIIMVTSALPGEGKSYTALNLAISIAMEMDHTALLVDADVAKPSALRYLNAQAELGLVDYLTQQSLSLSEILLKTNIPKFTVLPAGKRHNYTTELLASANMKDLMLELSQRYPDRVIIVDCPPLLVTSEARVLTALAGQIVVVVEASKTPQSAVGEAVALLDHHKPINLLLNKCEFQSKSGYGYGYGTYGNK